MHVYNLVIFPNALIVKQFFISTRIDSIGIEYFFIKLNHIKKASHYVFAHLMDGYLLYNIFSLISIINNIGFAYNYDSLLSLIEYGSLTNIENFVTIMKFHGDE